MRDASGPNRLTDGSVITVGAHINITAPPPSRPWCSICTRLMPGAPKSTPLSAQLSAPPKPTAARCSNSSALCSLQDYLPSHSPRRGEHCAGLDC
jgi:hypothetical protein